jgi:hypothetical protein
MNGGKLSRRHETLVENNKQTSQNFRYEKTLNQQLYPACDI